jgi:nucleotide-binding universal stress UspA family protein
MFDKILIPLDGSEFSEDALPMARALARVFKAELHLVHVIRPAPDADLKSPSQDLDWTTRIREGAGEYLNELAEGLEGDGLGVQVAVLEGRVVPTLSGYVREQEIPLLVMTTHGSGGLKRWWLGSVADGLLREGASDVLLVRPWDDTEDRTDGDPRFGRVAVPLDGSEIAEVALAKAMSLAGDFDAEVTAIRVVPAPVELTSVSGVRGVRVEGEGHRSRVEDAQTYLRSVRDRVAPAHLEVRVVEGGSAAEGVIQGARQAEADLLVLSSHGRGGLARLVLGSVADKVVRGTTLPVLVVRPEEDE